MGYVAYVPTLMVEVDEGRRYWVLGFFPDVPDNARQLLDLPEWKPAPRETPQSAIQ
jgi:hypothetical protein